MYVDFPHMVPDKIPSMLQIIGWQYQYLLDQYHDTSFLNIQQSPISNHKILYSVSGNVNNSGGYHCGLHTATARISIFL